MCIVNLRERELIIFHPIFRVIYIYITLHQFNLRYSWEAWVKRRKCIYIYIYMLGQGLASGWTWELRPRLPSSSEAWVSFSYVSYLEEQYIYIQSHSNFHQSGTKNWCCSWGSLIRLLFLGWTTTLLDTLIKQLAKDNMIAIASSSPNPSCLYMAYNRRLKLTPKSNSAFST